MTWQQFSELFRATGDVSAIYCDGQLAGFYWVELRERILHLHGLVLAPAFQGKGIGTAVMALLEDTFHQKAEAIELGVHRSNAPAVRLYEKTGFVTAKSLDDLGFLVMRKRLKSVQKP